MRPIRAARPKKGKISVIFFMRASGGGSRDTPKVLGLRRRDSARSKEVRVKRSGTEGGRDLSLLLARLPIEIASFGLYP